MTLSEIRDQLAVVAQRNGRPPYDLCVLKAVRFAVMSGIDHPLKEHLALPRVEVKEEEITEKSSNKVGPKVPHATKEQVNELCEWIYAETGRQMLLAEKAGTSASILWRMAKSGTCTKKLYDRLTKAKNAVLKQSEDFPFIQNRKKAVANGLNQYQGRECKKCNTTARYVESNRCVHCMKAHYYRNKEMAA